MPTRTIAQTREAIRATGCNARWSPEYSEWQVNPPGTSGTNAAYFTQDPEDAIGTAQAMARAAKTAT